MDEDRFWSSALGEWIKDCVSGTSYAAQSDSDPEPILNESSWRLPTNLKFRLRYAELCDGIALNHVFLHMTNSSSFSSSSAFVDSVAFLPATQFVVDNGTSSADRVQRSESLSSGVSSSSAVAICPTPMLVSRTRHLQHLLAALCTFYRSKSLLVVSLPDVICIARSPLSELSSHEMHKLLALLLGAAVQSPKREQFIERIRRMRTEVQSELAEEIQRVTTSAGVTRDAPVVNLDILLTELENGEERLQQEESGGGKQKQKRVVTMMIEKAIRQREELASRLIEVAQELDQDETGPSSGASSGLTTASSSCNGDVPAAKCPKGGENGFGDRSPSPNALGRHASVELAAAKAELRKMRNENEEKEEMLLELQDEMNRQRSDIDRLERERLELVKDARAAKDYRDELDCLQHKLGRLEKLEAENGKLQGKLGELDFYRSRVNHLKEDNNVMQETCRVMEEQLEQSQRKLSTHLEVEAKLIEAQAAIKSLQLDLTKTREQVEDLLVQNGRLERELKINVQKRAELEREIQSLTELASPRVGVDSNGSLNDSSLLAQLNACNQSQILELQLENKKLKAQLENSGSSPTELFEVKSELAAMEKLVQERTEERSRVGVELELAKQMAEQNEEQAQKMRAVREQLERQLLELKRNTVPAKAHQTLVEKMERIEQREQELELRGRMETEKLESSRAEKVEVEAQLQKMRMQHKETRAELDELREQWKAEQIQWERQRKAMDTERGTLKVRAEMAERTAEEKVVGERNAENAARRMAELEKELAEREERMARLDAELGQSKQQVDAEKRKTHNYWEELALERNRLSDLLARLRSVCLMAIRSGRDQSEQFCLAPSCLEDDAELIAVIDDLLMKALSSARKEADSLRIQQQKQIRELDDLKRDIQGLRKTGHELNASDDKLLVENRNIKEQVNLLQERLHKAQSEECAKSAELQAARKEIEELQQKTFVNSRQYAELSNLQMMLDKQKRQEEQLRRQLAAVESQREVALREHSETQKRLDSLELIHSALASDHDRLQNLHQMLSSDYERLKKEKEIFRQKLKGEKMSAEQILRADFVSEKAQLEKALESERSERQREGRRAAELESELARRTAELAELKRDQNSTAHRNEDCLDELRRLRMAECANKSTINGLNVLAQQLNNALTEKDLELGNMRREVEMLRQYNGDENKTLIRQIELLLIQNQQLHNRSDVFFAEQKELQEKLLTLRRHKEKLEEKIMEQYKAMDSRKLERQTFMKRAAKALIAKSPSRKGRHKDGNGTSDKSEESSIYSTENETNGGGGRRTPPALTSPPPPPPPCPFPARTVTENGFPRNGDYGTDEAPPGTKRQSPNTVRPLPQALPLAPHRRNGSICSSSQYSSISNCPQNSIDRDHHHLHHNQHNQSSQQTFFARARNSRFGGSLRNPPSMARSFPAPPCSPAWRRVNETDQMVKLPACCKVMQEDILLEDDGEGTASAVPLQAPVIVPIQQPRIIRELPPKVPAQPHGQQNRPPPPPYPGLIGQSRIPSKLSVDQSANGNSRIRTSPSPSRAASHESASLSRQNNASSLQQMCILPPRDSSTPMSSSSTPQPKHVKYCGSSTPSPIGFIRANNLAQTKQGEAEGKLLVTGIRLDNLAVEGDFRENVRDTAERAEKAASVYENVADKSGGGGGGAERGTEERRGEKGEVWYELGCV